MELDEIYENFGNIYTSKIVPNLAPFESKRRSIEKKYNSSDFISMVLGVTSTILVFICKFMDDMNYLNKNTDTILTVILICGFAISAIFCYIAKDIDRKFRDSVKSEILPIILSLFGEFTVKTPTQQKKNKNILKTSLTEIKKLGFFHQAEKKKDDDTIEGIYKNLEINITETTLEHEEYYVRVSARKTSSGMTCSSPYAKKGVFSGRTASTWPVHASMTSNALWPAFWAFRRHPRSAISRCLWFLTMKRWARRAVRVRRRPSFWIP